jgi:hypothetical protein
MADVRAAQQDFNNQAFGEGHGHVPYWRTKIARHDLRAEARRALGAGEIDHDEYTRRRRAAKNHIEWTDNRTQVKGRRRVARSGRRAAEAEAQAGIHHAPTEATPEPKGTYTHDPDGQPWEGYLEPHAILDLRTMFDAEVEAAVTEAASQAEAHGQPFDAARARSIVKNAIFEELLPTYLYGDNPPETPPAWLATRMHALLQTIPVNALREQVHEADEKAREMRRRIEKAELTKWAEYLQPAKVLELREDYAKIYSDIVGRVDPALVGAELAAASEELLAMYYFGKYPEELTPDEVVPPIVSRRLEEMLAMPLDELKRMAGHPVTSSEEAAASASGDKSGDGKRPGKESREVVIPDEYRDLFTDERLAEIGAEIDAAIRQSVREERERLGTPKGRKLEDDVYRPLADSATAAILDLYIPGTESELRTLLRRRAWEASQATKAATSPDTATDPSAATSTATSGDEKKKPGDTAESHTKEDTAPAGSDAVTASSGVPDRRSVTKPADEETASKARVEAILNEYASRAMSMSPAESVAYLDGLGIFADTVRDRIISTTLRGRQMDDLNIEEQLDLINHLYSKDRIPDWLRETYDAIRTSAHGFNTKTPPEALNLAEEAATILKGEDLLDPTTRRSLIKRYHAEAGGDQDNHGTRLAKEVLRQLTNDKPPQELLEPETGSEEDSTA